MTAVMIRSMPRIASLVIGYFFGCLLFGELVVRLKTGKSASEFGTGNPGMANVTVELGLKPGLVVLAGDLLKTVAACLLCLFLFGGNHFTDPSLNIGRISCLWAGFGAVLGHNWPFWRHFSGGKGVAVTCMSIFIFSPIWGLLADLSGMLVVMMTGYLPLGAVVITAVFFLFCILFAGSEAAVLALILAIIMFSRHFKGLVRMARGQEEKYAQIIRFPSRRSGDVRPDEAMVDAPEAPGESSQEQS